MIHFQPDMILGWVGSLMWPFLRISGLFMVAPVFGSRSVPVRVRVSLAFLLAWMISGAVPVPEGVAVVSVEGFLLAAIEVITGLAMGFLMLLTFTAVILAGQTVAMTSGLGFAMAIDPGSGVQVPVVSQFMLILATLIFLGSDGHLAMVAILISSFEAWPAGQVPLGADTFLQLASFLGHVFAMALVMALPALLSVLMVNLALGIVTRAAPQLNIFAVGFPISIMVGFLVLLLSLDVLSHQSIALFERAFEELRHLM